MRIREDVPLAPMTSLRVGGGAKRFVEATDANEIVRAVADADARGERVLVLGGGSNLVVGDAGFDGLVVRVASRGVTAKRLAGQADRVQVDVEAGEPWDDFVARCVSEGWSGVECLSGIPGLAGATPIQNVGAYGQEVKETITSVRVLDRQTHDERDLAASECGFAYRASMFKCDARFVVTRVTFELDVRPDGAPVRYAELARALGVSAGSRAPLEETRRTVIALRRVKGMVLDAADPDSVSAGSFFVNPVLDDAQLASFIGRALARGIEDAAIPRFPNDDGRTKLSAGWLIERSGFAKGWGPSPEARVGISRKHALALVNRGGATCAELLDVARAIQRGVESAFGVALVMEPVMVGE